MPESDVSSVILTDINYNLQELWKSVEKLREEYETLVDSLLCSNVLSHETLHVQRHKRDFAVISQAFPCSGCSLANVADSGDPCFVLAQFAGARGVRSLSATCSLHANAVRAHRAKLHFPPPQLLVCGGEDKAVLNSAEMLGTNNAQWSPLPPLPTPQRGAAAATIDGLLYLVGGFDGSKEVSTLSRFDPSTYAWEHLPAPCKPRTRSAVGVVNGRLLVAGGTAAGSVYSDVDVFNPGDYTWDALSPLPGPRMGGAAAVIDGSMYVCGGSNGKTVLNSVVRFRTAASNWEAMPELLVPRRGAVAVALKGSIYVCGGHDGTQALSSGECFDTVTELGWRHLPRMHAQRFAAGAAIVSGCIYVCGGSKERARLDSVERFEPDKQTWELMPNMSAKRFGPTVAAVLL